MTVYTYIQTCNIEGGQVGGGGGGVMEGINQSVFDFTSVHSKVI